MPTYRSELRVCKICGKPYHADVLTSSNTFSQSIESINREITKTHYWCAIMLGPPIKCTVIEIEARVNVTGL